MKSVRMFLTSAIVIAIVGSSLAFTKTNPNLYTCASFQCIKAGASSFNSGGATLLTTDFYTANTATTNIDCFKPGSTTQGCSSDNHPQQAFENN